MTTLRINGEHQSFDAAPTVLEVVAMLGLVGKRIAVEMNGRIVPKSLYPDTRCSDGDAIEIVVAVGGG